MGLQAQRRNGVADRLSAALERGDLELHYQPQVQLVSGALSGVEALARWHDEVLGTVDPAEFVPVAEECGLIVALGEWSLEQAARQWRQWVDAGIRAVPRISVNVSAAQLADAGFAARAEQIVRRQGAEVGAIELEIIESVLGCDQAGVCRTLERLAQAGFGLAIDDFGTGYSSLTRLQSFPVSRLKLDRSFIHGLHVHFGSQVIVAAVINMAHALYLQVVAEGVENREQLEWLRQLCCDHAQGHLFARALPVDEFRRQWLQSAGPE